MLLLQVVDYWLVASRHGNKSGTGRWPHGIRGGAMTQDRPLKTGSFQTVWLVDVQSTVILYPTLCFDARMPFY